MPERAAQLLLALVFLTRVPLAHLLPARRLRLSGSAWAFPIVGAAVGGLAALPLLWSGPPLLMAVLSVALSIWLTGALHEDALADLADAAGGRDAETRLAIMRDSRIGSFGTMTLLLVTAARIASLSALGPWHLIAASAGGRAGIVLAMARLAPARRDGLGRDAGRPGARSVAAAGLIALLLLFPAGPAAWAALAAGLSASLLVMRRARIWLGGQTGDVLGATSVLTETAMLVAFATFGAR